jgi:crossover junction endodeoxyribonuclease RuvC
MGDRYLGLDMSMSSTGVAVVEVDNKRPKLLLATRIKTNSKHRHGLRLYQIARTLRNIEAKYGPFKAIIREKGFSRFAAATQAIFKSIAMSDVVFKDYDIEEYSPTTVKKTIAGAGKSSKDDVESMVRELLELDESYKFESDDASDACGIVLTYLLKEGLIN